VKVILTTQDPTGTREFDRDLLRRREIRLWSATSMRQVYDRALIGPDLIFLDEVLPDGSAFDVRAALEAHPTWRAVPVVLVQAPGSTHKWTPQRLDGAGFCDVLPTPAPPGLVARLVARHLGLPLRRDHRFAVRVSVYAAQHSSDDYLGVSLDLSEMGLLLRARRPLIVGDSVAVRFRLPGGAVEIQPRARVVRCTRSGGAWLVATEWSPLEGAEGRELRDCLERLVRGRPLSWRVTTDPHGQVVSLFGALTRGADLSSLQALSGPVRVRLAHLRASGVDTAHAWLELASSLTGVTQLCLEECALSFAQELLALRPSLERHTIRSLFIRLRCPQCGLDEERLVELDTQLDRTGRLLPPATLCPICRSQVIPPQLDAGLIARLPR
jgi:CheY-like chemotaxis protein